MFMKPISADLYKVFLFAAVSAGFSSCIDEDLSDCPPEEREISILYRIEAEHDVDNGFDAELHDLRLGFWNSPSSLYTEAYIEEKDFPADMVFQITLPSDDYSHVAVANGIGGREAYFPQTLDDVCVRQDETRPDTICGMAGAAFTGNLSVSIEDSQEALYTVLLKPVVGLVKFDVTGSPAQENVRCYISGTKAGYNAWHGTWIEHPSLVTDGNVNAVDVSETQKHFEFYSFPTMAEDTKALAGGDEWHVYFYATDKENGNITQYIFSMREPLLAGRVFEASFELGLGEGWTDAEAGVTIQTDWKPGNDYNHGI